MLTIEKELLAWYQENKRDLPWRRDKEPYHVWISEVMLQQTRIEAVISYYHRFMKELPTIKDLANCSEEKLLKLWEGLGYYNRARNLQKAAKKIHEERNGIFPTTYEEILTLPGIGEYTASAISSICFSEKQATVDGNVLRVFTRLHNDFRNIEDGKVKQSIREEIQKNLPDQPGDFNEAMMELGEVICLPNGTPKCEICPLQEKCFAKKEHTYMSLPVKEKTKKITEEELTVFLFHYKDQFAICKRHQKGLLQNLWEFPNISGKYSKKKITELLQTQNLKVKTIQKGTSYTHIFTHKKWHMTSYLIELEDLPNDTYQWITKQDLKESYALPSAFKPFLQEIYAIIEKERGEPK